MKFLQKYKEVRDKLEHYLEPHSEKVHSLIFSHEKITISYKKALPPI